MRSQGRGQSIAGNEVNAETAVPSELEQRCPVSNATIRCGARLCQDSFISAFPGCQPGRCRVC